MNAVLVTLATASYLDPAKQLFAGACLNGKWPGDFLLLADGIGRQELAWFEERNIRVVQCKEVLPEQRNSPAGIRLSTVAKKILIFTEYFTQWDNVVYVDSDVLVRGPIDGLGRLQGFNAVQDYKATLKRQLNWGLTRTPDSTRLRETLLRRHGPRTRCFNAGLMAFDTGIIHPLMFRDLHNLFAEYQDHIIGDQVVLNLFFKGLWQTLPLAYNYSPFLAIPAFLTSRVTNDQGAVILHFTGEKKPWNCRYSRYFQEWTSMLEQSQGLPFRSCPDRGPDPTEQDITDQSRRLNLKLRMYRPLYAVNQAFGSIMELHFPGAYQRICDRLYGRQV